MKRCGAWTRCSTPSPFVHQQSGACVPFRCDARPPARTGRRATATPDDIAVLATRVLATGGRLGSRVKAVARRHQVDPYVLRLLLLFAESDRPLRIGNVAELLDVSHATASRAATRAQAAGLVDKFATPIDGREVTVRLTYPGRAAVVRCLDALRVDAAVILRHGPVAPQLRRTSENAGHRAGVRIGMTDQ